MVSVKTEPEVAMPNTPNSETTSKKRKRSKSKSKMSLPTSSAEASESSTDSSAVFSLDDSQDLNDNVGQYQCDLCEEVMKVNTVAAIQPFICEPCQETYKAASASCLCKGVMNSVIKTMISCEICQSWYHESCVGVSEKIVRRSPWVPG